MNILYISHLSTNIASGPNWSVPAGVKAQSKIDNVFWINTTNVLMEHWKSIDVFHNVEEFGKLELANIPSPFDSPDIVVFEGFNFVEHAIFAQELYKKKFPYVVIPRGAITYEAQHNHAWLKKKIANFIFFNSFLKHACCVQYLTEGEKESSKKCFNLPNFVLPNGFDEPLIKKSAFHQKSIKSVFIGRLDMFHKGLDLLLNAISNLKEFLSDSNFSLDIYGPQKYDYDKLSEEIKNKGLSEIITLKGVIGGVEKEKVLLDADLFIMTSRLEGHPMGLIEALAYGVPAFVTRGTNMKDEIEQSNAGWACEGSVGDIENLLLEVINNKNDFSLRSKNAIKLAKNYNWNVLASRFHEHIKHFIQKK